MNSAAPRLAATLAVVRDTAAGLEVLLLQRADKGDHNSGAWVFPGGLVDAGDGQARVHCVGADDAAASALLGLEAGGLDHCIAAIRESFEEAGLLFADTADGHSVDLQGEAGARLLACRHDLHRGERDLADVCREFGLRLRTDLLHYIAHWLTPLGRAKRFDTRFFVAVLPAGQASAHDAVETVQQVWLRPAQALSAENTRRLMTPTRAVLEQLANFADTAALLAWARTPREVTRVLPRLATGPAGPNPILPGHPAWDEVGRLDPDGRGDAWCETRPGVAVMLSAEVRRLTAAYGTSHSYLVACGAGAWAVIDPGPGDPVQLDALIAAAPGPLRWICLTDGDAQQVQAAAALQARTGARLLGPMNPGPAEPGPLLRGLRGPDDTTMNYLFATEGLLFTGAHALPADTQVAHAVRWLAPRHGFLVQVQREATA